MLTAQETSDASLFLQACYVTWVVGLMDPEMVEELDAMTPAGGENWLLLMRRTSGLSRCELQARFWKLCEEMSDEEAMDCLLEETLGIPA